MAGRRYTVSALDVAVPSQSGKTLHINVPDQAIEFWTER